MLYSEHLRFSKKGVQIVDRHGVVIGVGQGIAKASRRVWSFVEDFELLIVRVAGLVPIYSIRWLIVS